ncbi:hypothetical protein [Compostibacter hankyongensis]|uniref:DUF2157 domain-containing protein n=1 Tax=Compostibacter hankyongensis TaxID=1007089 RepID=A0ABP8FCN0_9BACT
MPEVDKKEARLLLQAIASWQEQQQISAEQAAALRQSIRIKGTNWRLITLYFFIAAVSCALMAFGALVLDEKWIEVLRKRFALADGSIAALFAALSALLCIRHYRKHPQTGTGASRSFSGEAFWLLPFLTISVSIVYLGKSLDYLHGQEGLFFLFAALIFGAISRWQRSLLLWAVALLALVTGILKEASFLFGPQTGLNLPCRLFLLSALLLLATGVTRRYRSLEYTQALSWYGSWLLLLLAAWLISIFGNTATWEAWQALHQSRFIYWDILFTLLIVGVIWLGIRRHDQLLRDTGIVFMLLNLYTRYFEYFWDHTHKGIFFAVLAASLWWIGKTIEKKMGRR